MKTYFLRKIRASVVVAVLAAAIFNARAASPSATPLASPPGSVSEMLEKGIYDEETKGDIDGAITIYQQLLAQIRANDSLAAQAEYRLAQCFLKKNRKDEATAAFQKLVADYPNEKELVAKAKEFLIHGPELLPAPWVDGERLQLKIFYATGVEGGITEYRADLVQSGTQAIWRVGALTDVATMHSASSVDVDAQSFRPVSSRWKTSLMGAVEAEYRNEEVELWRGGKPGPMTTVKTQGPVIDNEEAMDYIRRLPLKVGFTTTLPIFSTMGGQGIPIGLQVTGTEMVEVPFGKFECLRVPLSVGQTFWFSNDAHRYLVKFDAGAVSAKLTSVLQRKADEPVTFRDGELGVSLTAPPNWVICRYKNGQPDTQTLIRTYDAGADTDDGGVRYFETSSLAPEAQKSSKAWAESRLKQDLGDGKMRPDGWKDYTVAGLPGAGFTADISANGKPQTFFSLYVVAPKESEHFVLICPKEKFESLMKDFDGIIGSYQRK